MGSSSIISSPINTADRRNTARQPNRPAVRLAAGRASIIPKSRPLIILPTIRPRWSAGANEAA
ncbi:hypothetical protein D3C81_2172350 [compost metagenome]